MLTAVVVAVVGAVQYTVMQRGSALKSILVNSSTPVKLPHRLVTPVDL